MRFMDGLLAFMGGLEGFQWLYYFWPFFVVDFARYVLLDTALLAHRSFGSATRRDRERAARHRLFQERPLVSVLSPGKNEGKNLQTLVDSLDLQTYKHFELIVVDDGSDDDTPQLCRRLEREGRITRFIRNDPRGGKASAANTALLFARGDYVVHLDADSNLRHDALERVILPFFMEENVGAVGGDIRVENVSGGLIVRCQALEYFKSISIGRTASAMLGILRTVSGAFGAFPRDVLERLGGWDVGPGLDGDLTVKIRKLGYRVVHAPEAVCYTNVPSSVTALSRQRYRWDRSMVRFRLRKHRDIFDRKSANFRWSNFFSGAENVLFSMGLNAKWWVYFIQMLILHPTSVKYLFVINFILYALTNLWQHVVAVLALEDTMRDSDIALLPIVLLMPLYTGLYLRSIRTFAHIMEIFHRASYRDQWNPWKVSRVAESESL
jgi:biofilm PGA synthesis N-glycosyltransferase PgaC